MAASSYKGELLQEAKQYALQTLGLRELKPEQSQAIDTCINNFDTFISLPTGFGKSVVFQCVPICHDYLRHHSRDTNSDKSLAIVILPLKALANDQVKRAQSLGIEAASVIHDISDEVMDNACRGKYSLLFTSPEVLLSHKGKELLQSTSVYSRLCGLFIDESHCVVKWGQSSGVTGAFRKFYGLLAELRSFMKLQTPIAAMTATATQTVRSDIITSLGMQNVVLITSNPVLSNIKHVVVNTKRIESDAIFSWLCDEIAEREEKTERVIVFCQSRKDCSELFSLFKSRLSPTLQKHFNMYHTNTESDIQAEICDDFRDPVGCIRVLFSTIAFGLGVDVKGVNNVIMYGAPQGIDDYIQLAGRGGRDGSQSLSVTLKKTRTGRSLSTAMKEFVNTTDCRSKVLVDAFPGAANRQGIKLHDCCDNCAPMCLCSSETEASYCKPSHIEEQLINLQRESAQKLLTVSVTGEEHQCIKQELFQLQQKQLLSLHSEHIYTSADVASDIPASTINMILDNLHLSLTFSQFCMRYALPNVVIRNQIWDIVNEYLGAKYALSRVDTLSAATGDDDLGESSSDEDLADEELLLAEEEYREPLLNSSDSE